VLAEVQSIVFILTRDAQTGEGIHDQQNDPTTSRGKSPSKHNRNRLIDDRMPVTLHQAQPSVNGQSRRTINRGYGKNAGEDRADRSPDAVDSKRVQRIVVPETSLDDRDRAETGDARG
jgi:hypothetical protein